MVKPLHSCVRDTRSLRFSILRETGGPAAARRAGKRRLQAVAPARRRRGPARPHLHRQAGQRGEGRRDPRRLRLAAARGRRHHPAAPHLAVHARQPGRAGRRGARATCSRRCATSPGSPRCGRSRRPSTRIWSRTGTSTTPTPPGCSSPGRRCPPSTMWRPARPSPPTLRRHALYYPAKEGCGMALARLLAQQDEAAADDPDEPGARAAPIFQRDDIVVRLVDVTRRARRTSPRLALGVSGTAQGRRADRAARRRRDRRRRLTDGRRARRSSRTPTWSSSPTAGAPTPDRPDRGRAGPVARPRTADAPSDAAHARRNQS